MSTRTRPAAKTLMADIAKDAHREMKDVDLGLDGGEAKTLMDHLAEDAHREMEALGVKAADLGLPDRERYAYVADRTAEYCERQLAKVMSLALATSPRSKRRGGVSLLPAAIEDGAR